MVRVRLHPHAGRRGLSRHLRRDRLAPHGEEADRQPRCLQGQELLGRLHADRGHGRDPLCELRGHSAVRAAGARLHSLYLRPDPLARRHRRHHPDPHRRADHEARADALHRDVRILRDGQRALLFQRARSRHRLLDAGLHAERADGGTRLPVRADLDHRLSDLADASSQRRGGAVLDVPQRLRIDRHLDVDGDDHRADTERPRRTCRAS